MFTPSKQLTTSSSSTRPSNLQVLQIFKIFLILFLGLNFFLGGGETFSWSQEILEKESFLTVQGEVSDIPVTNHDGWVSFAVVFPLLRLDYIFNFDMDLILSPTSETITVADRKVSVPSNVVLPPQEETYFIVNAFMKKIFYQKQIPKRNPTRLYALRGKFPFKKYVDGVRNNLSFHQLLPLFIFQGGGIGDLPPDVSSLSSFQLDIKADQFKFEGVYKSEGLPFDGSSQILLQAGLEKVGVSPTEYIVTDIRYVPPKTPVNLRRRLDQNFTLLSVLTGKRELLDPQQTIPRQFSVTLTPETLSLAQYPLLPLIPPPILKDSQTILLSPPRAGNVLPLATYIRVEGLNRPNRENDISVLSDSDSDGGSGRRIEVENVNRKGREPSYPLAEVYLPHWVQSLPLPLSSETLETLSQKNSFSHLRIKVIFLGKASSPSDNISSFSHSPVGPQILEEVTHITQNSADFLWKN